MKESKYLSRFQKLAKEAATSYNLIGDFILVERIQDEEFRTKSGLIIGVAAPRPQLNTLTADRPNWVRVLAVGPGYYTQEEDEAGNIIEKTVPLDVCPGDIVLVSQVSVKYFSLFGEMEGYEADSIGLTKESEIQLRFRGEGGYREAFAALNGASNVNSAGTGDAQGVA